MSFMKKAKEFAKTKTAKVGLTIWTTVAVMVASVSSASAALTNYLDPVTNPDAAAVAAEWGEILVIGVDLAYSLLKFWLLLVTTNFAILATFVAIGGIVMYFKRNRSKNFYDFIFVF